MRKLPISNGQYPISIFLKKVFLFFAVLGLLKGNAVFAASSAIPERPNPPRLVNNLSNEMPDFLSAAEESALEQKLVDFANQTSNQIVIAIVDDLGGDEAWHFATELGHKWGVGQGKFDNGVVVLVKPTGGKGQRDAFIAVGYGLGGAIPDATANQIVDNELGPGLASGNYYDALNKTTDILMSLAKGEYNSDAYGKKNKKQEAPLGVLVIIILIIIFFMLASKKGGKGGGGGLTMGPTGWIIGSMLNSGRSSGGWGGGSSGGFGGFGGGGFGGGGAGGKW